MRSVRVLIAALALVVVTQCAAVILDTSAALDAVTLEQVQVRPHNPAGRRLSLRLCRLNVTIL